MVVSRRLTLGLLCAGASLLGPAAAATAAAAPEPRSEAERAAAAWVQGELRPFADESEFRRYMRDVRRAARVRGRWWARRAGDGAEDIFVTGSRIVPRNASITNVQEPGVDEGDVVKQIGRFLIVLQDGRLFSIDTAEGGSAGGRLALADRINVYRQVPAADHDGDTWYDELLVRGDRMVVTAYSYGRGASELSVFRLTEDGRFERDGVFEISSDDYYSPTGYATRLVGDNLLVYTPFDISTAEAPRLPEVRRIEPGDYGSGRRNARRLLDYRGLYGPVAATLDPTIHSVSICPLGPAAAGRNLACRTRGVVGPSGQTFYVSPTHLYLWTGPERNMDWNRLRRDDCPGGHRAAHGDAEEAIAYRIPIAPGDPEAVRVRGAPFDQFSFDEQGGTLRAFVRWESQRCDRAGEDPVQVSFASVPLSRFSRFVREAPESDYAALPPTQRSDVANRFTGSHLAYAPIGEVIYDRDADGRRVYETGRTARSELVVVPLARPAEARRLRLDHNVRRLEVLGNGFFVAGATAAETIDSSLSLIDVAREPRIGSTLRRPRTSGGEGRSHAFNLLLGPDGSGLFGLPTIAEPAEVANPDGPWWSVPSDVSFFSLDGSGRMRPAGTLASSLPRYRTSGDTDEQMADGEPDQDAVPGYSCEVSCVDWYGNSRPIFTDGRIFGLSATELIEGRLEDGRVVEVQRLDFARARPRGR
ncbi:MAG TPA: beta-propeller domain-containing protein [Allosphingosinicella sp.]|nr:beta-propeller domain-containing protein [Allosphingosinicella sp.]